jgi:hypothetical protein
MGDFCANSSSSSTILADLEFEYLARLLHDF